MAFKKGDPTINRKGRPKKGESAAEILRVLSEQMTSVDGLGKVQKLEAIMNLVYDRALKGNEWAINLILDRTDGKPLQQLHTTDTTKCPDIHLHVDGEVPLKDRHLPPSANDNQE